MGPSASAPVSIVVRSRGDGWRHALRPGDDLEVWRGAQQVGTLPAILVIDLIRHYVLDQRLHARVEAALLSETVEVIEASAPPAALTPPRKPLMPAGPRLRGATGRRLRGRTEAP